VLRHAGPAEATVRLSYAEDAVTVEITDTGAGGPASFVDGHGLHGMEQRVTALGGSLTAGPLPGRGFRVRARLAA
jgi:signal transduction histidine kinase